MLKLVYQAASDAVQSSQLLSDELTIKGREFSALLSLQSKFTEMGFFKDMGIISMITESGSSIGALVFMTQANEPPIARISKQHRAGDVRWVCEIRDPRGNGSMYDACIEKSQLTFLATVDRMLLDMMEGTQAPRLAEVKPQEQSHLRLVN